MSLLLTWAWKRVSSSYSHEPPHRQPQQGWWAPLHGTGCHCLHSFHLYRSRDFLFLRHSRRSARTCRKNEIKLVTESEPLSFMGRQRRLSNIWLNSDITNLVAAFLLWDSISCFRYSIPSMVSGPDSAPPRFGNVAEGSRREEASPLSLPGPFTDSDSEPCGSRRKMSFGELVKTDGWMDASERRSSRSQPNIKSRHDACFDLIAEPVYHTGQLQLQACNYTNYTPERCIVSKWSLCNKRDLWKACLCIKSWKHSSVKYNSSSFFV